MARPPIENAFIGFITAACVALLAYLSLASGQIACHGRGTLNARFQCECDPIFNGTHCEGCLCVNGVCPPRGIGPYGSQTQCRCLDSWTGPLCDFCCAVPNATSCVHVRDSLHSQLQCRGSTCARHYYGARCNIFCEPNFTCGSAKAVCRDDGSCSCPDQGEGWDPDSGTCRPCPIKCSGHGVCMDGPTCVCDDGYSGADCSNLCCPNASDVTHTTCGPGDACQCKSDGYNVFAFVPANTCEYACPGTTLDAKGLVEGRVCSGHGECRASNGAAACACRDGYKGTACNCAPETCANGGRCDESPNAQHICQCMTTYDPADDCRSCLPSWSGTDCQSFCDAKETCKSGSLCGLDGRCAACPAGTNATIRIVARTPLQPAAGLAPDGLQQVTADGGAGCDYAQVVVNDTFVVANLGKSSSPVLVDFGASFEAKDDVALQYVNATGCDECNDDFYPPPNTPSATGTCTTYCTRDVCTRAGRCNATSGACICDANVTGQFCENCFVPWGPAPGGEEQPCTEYCAENATTWAECLTARYGAAAPKLTQTVPCDEPCAYNFTAGQNGSVTCVSGGAVHRCSVPSSADATERNEDAYGMKYSQVLFADNATRVEHCAFCSKKGRCLLGSCTCGRRDDADGRSQYHGRHCALTCTAVGISSPCSGHGVCARSNGTQPPRCLCDGAGVTAASFISRCEKTGDCSNPPPADYFGPYCNRSAPVRYVQEAGSSLVRESICSGHTFLRLTEYDVVLNDTTQGYVSNVTCEPGFNAYQCCGVLDEAGMNEMCDQRTDVYCDPYTRLCTKLQCVCPNSNGGGNCGANCPLSMMSNCASAANASNASAPLRRVCAQSTCGHELPHMDLRPGEVIVLPPCSRGQCRPVNDSGAGDTRNRPSASTYPVPGQCHCYMDPDKAGDCSLNKSLANMSKTKTLTNEQQFVAQCCGKGLHPYGGGTNNYCGQDCNCDPEALVKQQGKCSSPFSSSCVCEPEFCGIGCSGKCPQHCIDKVPWYTQNNTFGDCFSTSYSTCACDCTGGFIQKTHFEFGFAQTRARLFVGPNCDKECLPRNATTFNTSLSAFSDSAEVQKQWLRQYLADLSGRCNGHGICGYDDIKGQVACICDTAHTGNNCNLTCFDDTLMHNYSQNNPKCQSTGNEEDWIETCGYLPCPHGNCSQTTMHDGVVDFRCIPTGNVQAGPSMINNTAICPCNESSSSYFYTRCLCNLTGQFKPPDDDHFAYAFGIMTESMFSSCSVCDQQQKTVPTADCKEPYISSGIGFKGNAAVNTAFDCANGNGCTQFGHGYTYDNTSVPVATQFALNRDCAQSYSDICGSLSLYHDDYYWAYHQDFVCKCDTSFVFVKTDETTCDTCSIDADIANDCRQTNPGEFFMDANARECATLIAEVVHSNSIRQLEPMSLHLPDGVSQAVWPSNLTNNARWTAHTFCNRKENDSACFPNATLFSANALSDWRHNTTYVGQFMCSNSSYRSPWGFNCVRNQTQPPQFEGAQSSLSDRLFGEYGEFSVDAATLPTELHLVWNATILICSNPQSCLEAPGDIYKYGVPFAALSGASAEYYIANKTFYKTNLTANSASAQCYNAHAFYMGTDRYSRSLCAYAAMYGYIVGGNAALPELDAFCDNVTHYLSEPEPSSDVTIKLALGSLPMMMTGDSCRDMLLTEQYVDAYYAKLKDGIGWFPFANSIEFNSTGLARLNDTFVVPQLDHFSDNVFIVPDDVALDYWCNPTSGMCESGRDYDVERAVPPSTSTLQARPYQRNSTAPYELASSNGDIGYKEMNVAAKVYPLALFPTNKQCAPNIQSFFNPDFGSGYVSSPYLCNTTFARLNPFAHGTSNTNLSWVHYSSDVQWYRCGNNSNSSTDAVCSCNKQRSNNMLIPDASRSFTSNSRCQEFELPYQYYNLSTPTALGLQLPNFSSFDYDPYEYPTFIGPCAAALQT